MSALGFHGATIALGFHGALGATIALGVALACTPARPDEGKGRPFPAEAFARDGCAADPEKTLPELPARAAGYCLLRGSDVLRYGNKGGGGLGAVCVELFDAECELYRSYGLSEVTVARYGDEKKSGRFVNVVLTGFDRASSAFGFFQRRALGSLAGEEAMVSPLLLPEGQGRAFLGPSVLYVWRGRQVAEFSYLSEDQTPQEMRAQSAEILPSFAAPSAASLGGGSKVPFEVEFLESLRALPPGVRITPDHWLEIAGSGPGAEAHIQGASGRYRVVLAVRADESGAKDLMRMVRQALGSPPSGKKEVMLKARRLRAGHTPESWLFVREGRTVMGLGPDESTLDELSPFEAEIELRRLAQILRQSLSRL